MNPEWLKVQNLFQQTSDATLAVCERLEHGEAHSPLIDQVYTINENLDSACLRLVLLGLCPTSRDAALRGLCGESNAALVAAAFSHALSVHVQFTDGKFGTEPNGSGVVEAPDAASLNHTLAGQSQPTEKLRLHLPGDAEVVGLNLVIPRDFDAISRSPTFFQAFSGGCSVLMLAGHGPAHIDAAVSRSLKEITPFVSAVLPVVLSQNEKLPATGWWNGPQLARGAKLLPEHVPTQAESAWPPLMRDVHHPQRMSLLYSEQCGKLRTVLELASERQERDARSLAEKLQDLATEERQVDERARSRDARGDLESLKATVEEHLVSLQEEVEDPNRKAMQRRGRFSMLVREMVNSIDSRSVRELGGARAVRNSLERQALAEMTDRLSECLRGQLREDVQLLTRGAQALASETQTAIQRQFGSPCAIATPSISESDLWQHLKGEVIMETRGDFELQAGGVMYFMNAGRMMIMPIFMLLSMFGFSRNAFPKSLLLVFVVLAVLYAISTFRKERQEKLEKELEKLRDILSNEATRVITDVQREKTARIAAFLVQLRKQVMAQVETIVKNHHTRLQTSSEQEKRELKAKIRSVDLRSRDMQEQAKALLRLQQQCTDVLTALARLSVDPAPSRLARTRA